MVPGGELTAAGAGGQPPALRPGQGGIEVVVGGHVGEGTALGYLRLARGVIEHQNKVAPAHGAARAELGGADAPDDAFVVAVLHRVVGPVAGGDVVVDVGGGDLDRLADPAGVERDGARPRVLGGGKQAVFVHRAHIALNGDGHRAKVPQSGAAPVAARNGELDLLAPPDGEGGQGRGGTGPADLEIGELVHHMELELAGQGAGGDQDGVGPRVKAGGVDPVLDGAQPVPGGVGRRGQIDIYRIQPQVNGLGHGQREGGTGQHRLAAVGGDQPVGPAVASPVGDQQQVGGAGSGPAVGGLVHHSGAGLPRNPDGQGGGAAAVQVDHRVAALTEQLLGQIVLSQAHRVGRLPAVHSVKDHGPVRLDSQCGAGLTAVGPIDPGGVVGDDAVPHHDVPHAAGPPCLGQGGVLTVGGQNDPVPLLKAVENLAQTIAGGGGEDVLVRADGDGLVRQDQLGDLQGEGGVDCEAGGASRGGVGRRLHAHIPAGALGPGGDGGKMLVEQVEPAPFSPGLVEVVGGDGEAAAVVFAVVAGLIDPVFHHQTDWHAGGHGEEIGVDGAQHMIALGLGLGDGVVDTGSAVDRSAGLGQDGPGVAARLQLQRKTLHPASAVDGDGIAVSQAVGELGGGLQLLLTRGGVDSGQKQNKGQQQRRHSAGEGSGMSHGKLLIVGCVPKGISHIITERSASFNGKNGKKGREKKFTKHSGFFG